MKQRNKSSAIPASIPEFKVEDMPPPLLKEVNDLIEKERELLELKLIDQQIESEKWKAKYDDLKEVVVSEPKKHSEGKLLQYEHLADIESGKIEEGIAPPVHTTTSLLATKIDRNLADFSSVPLTKITMAQIAKKLFSPRGSTVGPINVAWFSRCELGPDHLEAIEHAIRSSKVMGIDLSFNNIDEEMMLSLVEIISDRKMSPQYILFHGNMSFVNSEKAYLDLIHALSEETWGLTMTLEDSSSNPVEAFEKSVAAARKKGITEEELLFKQVKPPLRNARFLQSLRQKIIGTPEENDESAYRGKKLKAAMKAKVIKIGRFSKHNARVSEFVKSFSVLGLMQTYLNPPSIRELELLIDTIKYTLTDLDLSFSYMGAPGANMLSRVVADPECNLINLNLRGNVFRDDGALMFCKGLRKNKTLTALNLSSNAIGVKGLRNIFNSVDSNIMLDLNLKNNFSSEEEINDMEFQLREKGSDLFVQWNSLSKRYVPWRDLPRSPLLLRMPLSRKIYCPIKKSRRIFSIDLSRILKLYPDCNKTPILLRWKMRPVPVGDIDDVQGSLMMKGRLDLNNVREEPYLLLNDLVGLNWEIVVTYNRHEYLRTSQEVSPFFATKNILGGQVPWLSCSYFIKDPPKKAVIELRCKVESLFNDVTFDRHFSQLGVETQSCVAYNLPINDYFYLGGDGADVDYMQLQNECHDRFMTELEDEALAGQEILRCVYWIFNGSISKIKWKSKLTVVRNVAGGLGDSSLETDNDGKPKDHDQVDYEWTVSVHPLGLPLRVIKSQRCSNKEQVKDGASQLTELLSPWTWQDYEIDIEELTRGDIIIISAKIIGKTPKSTEFFAANAMVLGKQFEVFTYLGDIKNISNQEFNDLAPVFDDPRVVYNCPYSFRHKRAYDKDYHECDMWEYTFEKYGFLIDEMEGKNDHDDKDQSATN